jgi:hypothetical protein
MEFSWQAMAAQDVNGNPASAASANFAWNA